VTLTLSPPVRVFAFVSILVMVGLAGFFFLLGREGEETSATPTRTFATTTEAKTAPVRPRTTAAPRSRRAPAAVPTSGFPLPVHRALRRKPVVVVVVYMPRASVDRVVKGEARAAAGASGAGFVQLSALSGRLMRPLVAKAGVLPEPAVLVVKRPDLVAATFGVTDRQTIMQAVAHARRR
jgi:hypothetical protein